MDLSIVDVADGVFEILSTDGDLELGGSLIDERIVNFLADEFLKQEGVDLRNDAMALQRLYEASEKAKIELSSSNNADINIPYVTATETGPKHLVSKLSKAKFEQLIVDIIDKTIDISKSALEKSGLEKSEIDGVLLVGGSSRIPLAQEKLEKLFGKKPLKTLNPDHCVSTGASIQGSILSGDQNDILLLDCLGISIGIETMGNVMTKMVEANTTIPTRKSQVFSTAQDNQPSVEVVVLQGERPMSKDNKRLGVFSLEVEPAPRGIPQIEITYDLDSNGILTVTAEDKSTGKKNNITISGSSKLTDEEIEQMKKDAEINAEKDKAELEKVQKINEVDSVLFQVDKQVKEWGDSLEADDKAKLDEITKNLTLAKNEADIEKIDEQLQLLNTELGVIMQKIGNVQQEQTSNDAPNSEGTEDIEYEEVE